MFRYSITDFKSIKAYQSLSKVHKSLPMPNLFGTNLIQKFRILRAEKEKHKIFTNDSVYLRVVTHRLDVVENPAEVSRRGNTDYLR